jgi:fumarate reductase flavoprotein subunit/NADH-quinone oxidoreductase subunit F
MTKTFENAKAIGYADLLEKIKAAGLEEYGLCAEPLADKIYAACAKEGDVYVHAGLNNADVDGALYALLKNDPDAVLSGIAVAGMLTGAAAKFLYLPEGREELAAEIKPKAEEYKVVVVNDIINVRESEGDLLLHLATAKDLADLVDGTFVAGHYVVLPGEAPKKVAPDTKVTELVPAEGAKAYYLGYKYYTPEEAESLTAKDATNGVICALTEKDCIVDCTAKQLLKDRKASCGRCVFCREGLIQLEYMQKEITQARGKTAFADLTKEIGEAMGYNTLCTVGQVSADIALTAFEKFGDEYDAHIKKNKCPAGVCNSFVHIYIDPLSCTGCGDCIDVCPADCIEGKAKFIHMIDEFECTKCGKCVEACEEDAVQMTSGKLPKLPSRLTKVGKFKKH